MKRFKYSMALGAALVYNAAFADSGHNSPVDGPFVRAGQTQIDEAFESVTSGDNIYDPVKNWEGNLPEGYQAKRNAAYPWGTTTYKDKELWMGTISQGWCVWPFQNLNMPIGLTTYESEYTGCSIQNVLSTPSEIFVYNFDTGEKTLIHEGTLNKGGKEYTESKIPHEEMSAMSIMGLRAAGNIGDLVFMAGHHLHQGSEGWLRIYVFNAKERAFLGYRELRGDTTRRFKVLTDNNGDSALYTIIGSETGMGQKGDGPTVMLRWVGTQDEPFKGGNYLQTGDGQAAGWDIVSSSELDGHYGMIGDFKQFTHTDGSERLIMSSAAHPLQYQDSERDASRNGSVMLLSSAMPEGGWTRDKPMDFKVIFAMDRYDPEVYGRWGHKWGTTNIHNGYIYFGTYHQGTSAGYKHFKEANEDLFDDLTSSEEKEKEFLINTWRASSIFRMKLEDLDAIGAGTRNPDLLYGYETFKITDKDGNWKTVPNGLNASPMFGKAGMGNPGNVYSWTSLSKDGQLFWGFFDAFSGTHDLLSKADISSLLVVPGFSVPVPFWESFRDNSQTKVLHDWAGEELTANGLASDFVPGGDLVVFEGDRPARILTKSGFGNPCANGVRNVETINGRIFFVTSTWCNLSDKAGLEFYEYKPELDK
ncbi:MAG: hypothetical protein V7711_09290 [Pseudomonadales bacterium]